MTPDEPAWRRYLRFWRRDVHADVDDEVRFHIEERAAEFVAQGMSRDNALRAAAARFGDVEQIAGALHAMMTERERRVTMRERADTILRDLRYAARGLRRSPTFTLTIVITLALGIGATAGIFSVVDRLLFRPPAYLRDSDQVGRVYAAFRAFGKTITDPVLEYHRYQDLVQFTSSFLQAAVYSAGPVAVGDGQDASEQWVSETGARLFDFFDVKPALGRFYTPAEDSLPAGALVAVISYRAWQDRYAGSTDVLGSKIRIGTALYTIIGVAPKGFTGIDDDPRVMAWIPVTAYAATLRPAFYRGYHWGWLQLIVRRKPGVSSRLAEADLTKAYRRSWLAERELDPSLPSLEVEQPHVIVAPVQKLRGPSVGANAKIALWVAGVSLAALLVACANVASLLLGRAFQRRREIAIRLAMGVSRSRLAAQVLIESTLLATLGAAAGLAMAGLVSSGLVSLSHSPVGSGLPATDPRTLAFCAVVTLGVALLTGLAPAAHGWSRDVADGLRTSGRQSAYHRSRARGVFVVAQAAVSTALLIAAGLFVRSFSNVRSLRLGYDVEPIVFVERHFRDVKLTDAEAAALMHRLEERAAQLPGVVSATRVLSTPFYTMVSANLYVPGIDSVNRLGRFQMQFATPTYFHAIGTRILEGRGIEEQDRAGAPRVIVVSAEMARRLWPGRDALGRCVRVDVDTMPCSTVVGVAEDIRERALAGPPEAEYYLSADQMSSVTPGLYVRVRGNAADYVDAVRRGLQPLMPGASYVTAQTLRSVVDVEWESWRIGAAMFTGLGVLTLVIAAIGLYGVIAYGVSQRAHEMGLRAALGASVSDLVKLVVSHGARLGVGGALLGVALSAMIGRFLSPLLFAESPYDPMVIAIVFSVLAAVVLVACAVPAVRAGRADPNQALRAE